MSAPESREFGGTLGWVHEVLVAERCAACERKETPAPTAMQLGLVAEVLREVFFGVRVS